MKIALVMGNYVRQGYPPMGVLYLAGYIRKYVENCEIKVYDLFPDIQELSSGEYDVIGFSSMSIQYADVCDYAEKLKETYKGIILLGGVHITLTKYLPNWADYGIIGEGEETLREFIDALKDGKDMRSVKGLMYRIDDKVVINESRELIEDLDSIPFPAWDLIDMEPYLRNNNVYGTAIGRGLSLMTSRGCVYHCEYCAASKMWQKIRFHSAEYVVDMISYVVEKYKVEHIWMADDHFALKKSRLVQIADMMEERQLHPGIGISARVESYDEEMSSLLKRIGVKALALGLETGSDRMLKAIKNNSALTVEQETEVVKKMVADGFEVHGMFMINMPGETVEDMEMTVKYIHELPICKCSVSVAMPYYGTKWWDIAVSQGVVPENVTDTGFWRNTNMKKLEEERPIFKTEIPREMLDKVYDELTEYSKSLFYFDWEHR